MKTVTNKNRLRESRTAHRIKFEGKLQHARSRDRRNITLTLEMSTARRKRFDLAALVLAAAYWATAWHFGFPQK